MTDEAEELETVRATVRATVIIALNSCLCLTEKADDVRLSCTPVIQAE